MLIGELYIPLSSRGGEKYWWLLIKERVIEGLLEKKK